MITYKITDTTINKFLNLNDMVISLEGIINQGIFGKYEIEDIYSRFNLSAKYLKDVLVGNTLEDYSYWSFIQSENGYSIWKYSNLSNYQYNENNELYLDDRLIINKGEATSEQVSVFDTVYKYNDSTYTDLTTEASTEQGTEFDFLETSLDYFYFGSSSVFSGIKFELFRYGIDYDLMIEYYNGSSWVELEFTDTTLQITKDGLISWTVPEDWAQYNHPYDSINKYYIRISSSTPITIAKIYYIVPADSVIGLLTLSNDEIQNETWAWCTYGTDIYVTIPNSGNYNYVGISYIREEDDYVDSVNKQNYFIYNHEFKINHEDSSYIADSSSYLEIGNILDEDENVKFLWDTTVNSFLAIGTPVNSIEGSGLIGIMKKGDLTYRSISELFENPVLRIYSSDVTEIYDYIQFYHNQTNSVIESGNGDIELKTTFHTLDSTGAIYLNPINNIVKIKEDDAIYFGEPETEGTWRILRDSNDLIFERYESDNWVTKNTISA